CAPVTAPGRARRRRGVGDRYRPGRHRDVPEGGVPGGEPAPGPEGDGLRPRHAPDLAALQAESAADAVDGRVLAGRIALDDALLVARLRPGLRHVHGIGEVRGAKRVPPEGVSAGQVEEGL